MKTTICIPTKRGGSYIVHESTYKYKCLWGHHLWSCTCINQCSLSECHCVFLFLCEFLLPGVMFLKPGQPFTPTREQGQAYPWAPMCVVMCVCVFIVMHRCTTLWHLPSAFSSLSWFYMWMHCCVSKSVYCPVCLFSPEPAIGLFQTEMLHSDVFFTSIRVQLTCKWPWSNKTSWTFHSKIVFHSRCTNIELMWM